MEDCKITIEENKKVLHEKYLHSEEEAILIATYTQEKKTNPDDSPYKIINQILWDNKAQDQIQNNKSYLHLLLRALRKLPRVKSQFLYRGINVKDSYNVGDELEWKGFSSTSTSMKSTQMFLSDSRSTETNYEIMFEIRDMWGYDVSDFSMFSDEHGILIYLDCFLHHFI